MFSTAACEQQAADILGRPPAFDHIVRPEPVGDLVQRFFLPLEMLPTQNLTRGKAGWAIAKLRKQTFTMMRTQLDSWLLKRSSPLPGRPFIRCCRFSSSEPDTYNDGFKIAIDRLRPTRTHAGKSVPGLGLIADDSPRLIDLHQWWELAKRGSGFGMIEIYTGAAK